MSVNVSLLSKSIMMAGLNQNYKIIPTLFCLLFFTFHANAQSFNDRQVNTIKQQVAALLTSYETYFNLAGDISEGREDRHQHFLPAFIELFSDEAYHYNDLDPTGTTRKDLPSKDYAGNILLWYTQSGISCRMDKDRIAFGSTRQHQGNTWTIDAYAEKRLDGLYMGHTLNSRTIVVSFRIAFSFQNTVLKDFIIAGVTVSSRDEMARVVSPSVPRGTREEQITRNNPLRIAPQTILFRPIKYDSPVRHMDTGPVADHERDQVRPWYVLAIQENAPTSTLPGGPQRFKALYFGHTYYVTAEQGHYIRLAKDDHRRDFFLSNQAEDYGWVSKDHVLLWQQALIKPESNVALKAIPINSSSQIPGSPVQVYRQVRTHKDPGLRNPSGYMPDAFQILFIYQYSKDDKTVLLGRTPAFSERQSDNNGVAGGLIGWVSLDDVLVWDNRVALEPNDHPQAVSERFNKGIKTTVFQKAIAGNPDQCATAFSNTEPITDCYILWNDDIYDDQGQFEKNTSSSTRFPVIAEYGNVCQVAVTYDGYFPDHATPATGSVKSLTMAGYTNRNHASLIKPLFNPVLMLTTNELHRIINAIQWLMAATQTSGDRRELLHNAWIELLKRHVGVQPEGFYDRLSLEDASRMVFGVPMRSSMLDQIKLKDIHDVAVLSNNDLNRYLNQIFYKSSKLQAIANARDYPSSFVSYGVFYYWIDVELLP